MYKTCDNKMVNSYLLGDKGERELIEKGWRVVIAKDGHETEQELYNRLISKHNKVRIWRKATKVAGYHDIFALVK